MQIAVHVTLFRLERRIFDGLKNGLLVIFAKPQLIGHLDGKLRRLGAGINARFPGFGTGIEAIFPQVFVGTDCGGNFTIQFLFASKQALEEI
jgi:hypothetical protein